MKPWQGGGAGLQRIRSLAAGVFRLDSKATMTGVRFRAHRRLAWATTRRWLVGWLTRCPWRRQEFFQDCLCSAVLFR
jgi:hypothetical protein